MTDKILNDELFNGQLMNFQSRLAEAIFNACKLNATNKREKVQTRKNNGKPIKYHDQSPPLDPNIPSR